MAYQAGPFDAGHIYLQWGGKLPGGDEWSCGLRMAAAGNATSLDPQAMLTPVSTAVQAFHSSQEAQISPRAKLSFTKLNYINPAGHYAEDTSFEHIHADVSGGGTVALTPPNQVAIAVTLETGFSRGSAHRGRFYLPIPTIPIADDGRITAGSRDPLVASVNTFIAALNAVNANYDVAVFSRKLGSPRHRTVTGVHVGRVLDTQRRRRNKLAEAY